MILQVDTIHEIISLQFTDIQKSVDSTESLKTQDVTRGKVHNYLGMKIDFSAPDKLEITMNDSNFDILDDAPNDMIEEAVTPADAHLFQVNEEDPI